MKKGTQAEKVEQFVEAVQTSQEEKEKVLSPEEEQKNMLQEAWNTLSNSDKYLIYLVNQLQELSREAVSSLSQKGKDYVSLMLEKHKQEV